MTASGVTASGSGPRSRIGFSVLASQSRLTGPRPTTTERRVGSKTRPRVMPSLAGNITAPTRNVSKSQRTVVRASPPRLTHSVDGAENATCSTGSVWGISNTGRLHTVSARSDSTRTRAASQDASVSKAETSNSKALSGWP